MNAPVIKFRIGIVDYELRVGDLTPRDSADFRRAIGMPLMQTFGTVDLDVIAGYVWLLRRQTEHNLTFEEVATSFTYDDYVTVTDGAPVEDATDPPA